MAAVRILHVDDDASFRELTAEFLERADERFEVIGEGDVEEALDRLREDRSAIDCIVSDYQLQERDGLDFLGLVNERHPDLNLPFVFLTGEGDEAVAAEALNAGAAGYVTKGSPEAFDRLAERIRRCMQEVRDRRDSQRFDTLVRALNDPVYVLDAEGQFTYVNEAFLELVGYDRGRVIGSGPELIKDADAVAAGEHHLGRLLSTDGPDGVTFEVEIQPAEGDSILCEDHMSVLPYEGEQFRGSLGVLRDITDRKERERQLEAAKERYQLLVEQNLIGLYIAREGTLTYHNEPFAELFGRTTEANSLVGTSLLDLIEPADRDRLTENLRQVEGGHVTSLRQPYVGLGADGEPIKVELIARGIELDGTPAVLGTVVDVGAEEEQYWELRRERDRLEEFTSIVSHDLRNPLSVAKGRVQIVAATADLDDDAIGDLEKAEGALDRMEELLDDLLALAKQGEVVDDREPVGIRRLAENAWRNVATDAASLDVTATGAIHADASRIKGLFENLFRNAIEHGGTDVTVTIGDIRSSDARGFYVADDGPGVPPEDRDAIFDSGYTTAENGTGFGLAIVAEIVEAHGWTVRVTDGAAGGARFEITGDEYPVHHDRDRDAGSKAESGPVDD